MQKIVSATAVSMLVGSVAVTAGTPEWSSSSPVAARAHIGR
jgi:hypothetical protein